MAGAGIGCWTLGRPVPGGALVWANAVPAIVAATMAAASRPLARDSAAEIMASFERRAVTATPVMAKFGGRRMGLNGRYLRAGAATALATKLGANKVRIPALRRENQ